MKQRLLFFLIVIGVGAAFAFATIATWVFGNLMHPVQRAEAKEPAVIAQDSEPAPPPPVPDQFSWLSDQAKKFQISSAGIITASSGSEVTLRGTEGKDFKVIGEVLPSGNPGQVRFKNDIPDGFAFYLREKDRLHRYTLTTRKLMVKRRSHSGVNSNELVDVAFYEKLPAGMWLPFALEATGREITLSIGGQLRSIPGPVDTDGRNRLAVTAGTQLRNVSIQIGNDGQR